MGFALSNLRDKKNGGATGNSHKKKKVWEAKIPFVLPWNSAGTGQPPALFSLLHKIQGQSYGLKNYFREKKIIHSQVEVRWTISWLWTGSQHHTQSTREAQKFGTEQHQGPFQNQKRYRFHFPIKYQFCPQIPSNCHNESHLAKWIPGQ